jgi:aminoacylase
VAGKPIVILTWEGSEPGLPSILLNSHIDVVPVEETKWNTDPFGAHKDENGNIYARGAQDMKCVGIQHLEAVSRLKEAGHVPKRTVHISFVPDEEIGGKDGMEKFVKTEAFAALNVGFALDEGLANPGEECMTYYGERSAWWVVAEATGPTGHGSQLFQDTAVDRLLNFLQPYHQWRKEESLKLHGEGSTLALGDVTTVNINMIKAGAFSADGQSWQTNIIPSTAKCAIDMRVAPTVDLVKFEAELFERAAQFNVQITILQCMRSNPITSTDPSVSPWWHTFLTVCQQQNIKPKLAIFPAATDSRFLRAHGIPAIGFSPMNHTPVLLHDHNEYLNENTFLKGVDFFVHLVRELASLSRHGLDQ